MNRRQRGSNRRTIVPTFPSVTPDTIALVSGLRADIDELRQKLLATQVMVVDLQDQLEAVRAVAIVAAVAAYDE